MQNICAAILTMAAIYLVPSIDARAQDRHPAVCHAAPTVSTLTGNTSVIERAVAHLGDPHVLASLHSVRYETAITAGAIKVNSSVTRTFPDHMILVTRSVGIPDARLDASPDGAYSQISGGPKTQLPDTLRDDLLKTVRRDRFYIGQNITNGKAKLTDAGSEKIGDTNAAVLRLDIEGAKIVWYVDPLDGRLLRTIAQVPTPTGMIDQIVDLSDWRICDGLTIPFQHAVIQGTKISQETVISIELNPKSEETTMPGAIQTSALWQREPKTDPLRDTNFLQFSLIGKFLTQPRNASNGNPTLIVHCKPGKDKKSNHGYTNGKFRDGYIFVGGVTDSSVSDNGNSFVTVQFRLDDGKLQSESWGRSNDFSSIFFSHPTCFLCGGGYDIFANLLYGHAMYHKENTTPQVRKMVIGVSEYLGGEIVMQFDMPDSTEVAEACGIILHK